MPVPRWCPIRTLRNEPTAPLILPVRDVRVVFGPKRRHHEGSARSRVAQAHGFLPDEALTAEDGYEDPNMRALTVRASAAANPMQVP